MAKITDVPSGNARSHAERVPEDIRDRLTGEELRHRSEYVAHLHETAPLTGEAGRAITKHADRILRSLPLAEFLDQKEHWYEIADGLQGSAADDVYGAITKLRRDNVYPAGMQEAAESKRHGLAAGYLDADLDVILGRKDEQGNYAAVEKANAPKRKARPGEGYCQFCGDVVKGSEYIKGSAHWGGVCLKRSNHDGLEKAVRVATDALDVRAAELRKELAAYKAQIAADYAAAGRPVPPGFLTSPAQHPDAPKLRALEAEAQRFREIAKDVTEHELSEHYTNQAWDYEDRADKMRQAIEASA
jgi:hypothetical protein